MGGNEIIMGADDSPDFALDVPWAVEAWEFTDWRTKLAELVSEGYTSHANEDDRKIATSGTCPTCKAACTYVGLRRAVRGAHRKFEYRAFAVCGACNMALEF